MDALILLMYWLIININTFWGYLTRISAEQASTVRSVALMEAPGCASQQLSLKTVRAHTTKKQEQHVCNMCKMELLYTQNTWQVVQPHTQWCRVDSACFRSWYTCFIHQKSARLYYVITHYPDIYFMLSLRVGDTITIDADHSQEFLPSKNVWFAYYCFDLGTRWNS